MRWGNKQRKKFWWIRTREEEKAKREERKETNRREREGKKRFYFSLRFTKIGPWVFVESRVKVDPHNERDTRGYQNLGVSLNSTR